MFITFKTKEVLIYSYAITHKVNSLKISCATDSRKTHSGHFENFNLILHEKLVNIFV
jgi:hypothetical protein